MFLRQPLTTDCSARRQTSTRLHPVAYGDYDPGKRIRINFREPGFRRVYGTSASTIGALGSKQSFQPSL